MIIIKFSYTSIEIRVIQKIDITVWGVSSWKTTVLLMNMLLENNINLCYTIILLLANVNN